MVFGNKPVLVIWDFSQYDLMNTNFINSYTIKRQQKIVKMIILIFIINTKKLINLYLILPFLITGLDKV